jgi:hypothetical protein
VLTVQGCVIDSLGSFGSGLEASKERIRKLGRYDGREGGFFFLELEQFADQAQAYPSLEQRKDVHWRTLVGNRSASRGPISGIYARHYADWRKLLNMESEDQEAPSTEDARTYPFVAAVSHMSEGRNSVSHDVDIWVKSLWRLEWGMDLYCARSSCTVRRPEGRETIPSYWGWLYPWPDGWRSIDIGGI